MYILLFDALACTLSLILIILCMIQRKLVPFRNLIFTCLLLCVFFASFTGALSSLLINKLPASNFKLTIIVTTVYFCFNTLIPYLMARYLLGESHNLKFSKLAEILLLVPYVFSFTLIISNPYNKGLFFIDLQYNYIHGVLFFLIYIPVFIYGVIILILLLKGDQFFSRAKKNASLVVLFFAVTGIFLQRMFFGLVLETFASAMSCLFIFLIIQNPKNSIDSQTGALNKKVFEQVIAKLIHKRKAFSTLVVYSPDFSGLQETLDFTVYKKLSRAFYQWIKEKTEKSHHVCSLKEGAFCVIIKNQKKENKAQYIAMELLQRALSVWSVDETQIELTVQVGILSFPEHFLTFNDALDRISGILSMSQLIGDRHVFYATEVQAGSFSKKANLATTLKNLTATNTFELGIQELYSPSQKKEQCSEISLFTNLPSGEFIDQRTIFNFAQELGISYKIGNQLLEKACLWYVQTQSTLPKPKSIQIVLTEAQCIYSDWHNAIWEIIKKTEINPNALCLGISETAISSGGEQLLEGMNLLHRRGIQFMLDNYGTGYTDLSIIPHLPFSIIKLDAAIIKEGSLDKRSRFILAGTIEYLRKLGFTIAVNGIDNAERAELMIWVGCEYLQGTYFSPIKKISNGDL